MDTSILELMSSAKKFRKSVTETATTKLHDSSTDALHAVFTRALRASEQAMAKPEIPCPGLEECESSIALIKFILFARGVTLQPYLFADDAREHMDVILRTLLRTGRPAQPAKLDLVDARDSERFVRDYVLTSRAAVIRNFPCTAWDKWSAEWFRNRFGDEKFPLIDLDLEDSSEYTSELPLSVLFDKPNRYYFANSQRLFDSDPTLDDELGFQKLTEDFITGENGKKPFYHFSDQFFVSTGPKAKTPLHHGKIANYFFNIQGQKQWTMIHPEFSFLLYPFLRPFDGTSGIRNIDPATIAKVPLLQFVPYYEVVLEPGDILWTPYYWWHAVASLSQQNLAVATRWLGFPGQDFQDACPLISLTTLCSAEFHAERQRVARFERENPGQKYPWYDEFAHGRSFPDFGLHERWKPWGLVPGVS